jgi:hypothetical protein
MASRIREYEVPELIKKKTIEYGSHGELKVNTGCYRVWLWPQTGTITYQTQYQGKWLDCNPDGSFT